MSPTASDLPPRARSWRARPWRRSQPPECRGCPPQHGLSLGLPLGTAQPLAKAQFRSGPLESGQRTVPGQRLQCPSRHTAAPPLRRGQALLRQPPPEPRWQRPDARPRAPSGRRPAGQRPAPGARPAAHQVLRLGRSPRETADAGSEPAIRPTRSAQQLPRPPDSPGVAAPGRITVRQTASVKVDRPDDIHALERERHDHGY